MKNEITIPEYFPIAKEEDLKAADKRREDYSRIRDLQAKLDNEAIALRLASEEKRKESGQ
jgi:hypothetical protein